MSDASTASIDRFIDALWLEDGLSPNTLAAYRRDLSLFAAWLNVHDGQALEQAVMVAQDQPVNIREIKKWSTEEGFSGKFGVFSQALKVSREKKRQRP